MDPCRPHRDLRITKLASVLAVLGILVSSVELLVLGRLTAPGVALDSIAASLVPLAVIAMFVRIDSPPQPPWRLDEDEDEDGGGGGGGRGDGSGPHGPSGGLDIDWGRFEREFHAYAQRVTRTLEPTRA